MTHKIQFTLKSGNEKTGPIPVSMSERATCPDSCSFKGRDESGKLRGCYAESWPLSTHWNKVPERGVDFEAFCQMVAALPPNSLWRHNQAGDLAGENNTVDGAALAQLILANRGRRGFTYTHKPGAREALAMANRNGFTVNVSCDSLEQVDSESAAHPSIPLVVVLPMLERDQREPKVTTTPQGRRVVTCPAQWRETSCAECQMCQVADRDYVIGFRAHGIARRVVSNLVTPSSLVRSNRTVPAEPFNPRPFKYVVKSIKSAYNRRKIEREHAANLAFEAAEMTDLDNLRSTLKSDAPNSTDGLTSFGPMVACIVSRHSR